MTSTPDVLPIPSMTDLFPSWADRGHEGTGQNSPEPDVPLADVVRGRTVLLTGAGGSLGRVLARRLAALPAGRLLLLDTSEQGLVQLRERLEGHSPPSGQTPPSGDGVSGAEAPALEYLLANLRLEADRARALRAEPDVVIHAAAYKQVPFLEERPIPAAQNNLLATADWLWACRDHASVRRFVLVSTDKAVRPAGVMGRTKAAAERLLRALGTDVPSALAATTARLCNVFGSRGSVVPRFCRQLREGEAVTVTHPDMERWFIDAEGAARAVLQSLRHEPGTYVPGACRRVRIEDLARRLVRWHRPDAAPDDWIRHVGPRAGERLQEALLTPEERPGAPVDGGLRRARPPERTLSMDALQRRLEQLRRDCEDGAEAAVRDGLRAVAGATGPPSPAAAQR